MAYWTVIGGPLLLSRTTSTPSGDKIESIAIDQIFHKRGCKANVSSTKSQIGHLLGAAGAVEAIYSILCLNNNLAPYNLNLDKQPKKDNLYYFDF